MTDEMEVRSPRGRRVGVAIAAFIFAGGLITGAVLAGWKVAGAQSGSPSPSPKADHPFGGRGFGFGTQKGHGFGHFGRGALHGEFTVPAPGGGYQTLAVQRGEVTSVGSSSITVKSEDGFSRTYAVDDNTLVNAGNDGISDVKKGDTVRVTAIVRGGSASAVDIVDATKVRELRRRWMPPRPAASPRASGASTSA